MLKDEQQPLHGFSDNLILSFIPDRMTPEEWIELRAFVARYGRAARIHAAPITSASQAREWLISVDMGVTADGRVIRMTRDGVEYVARNSGVTLASALDALQEGAQRRIQAKEAEKAEEERARHAEEERQAFLHGLHGTQEAIKGMIPYPDVRTDKDAHRGRFVPFIACGFVYLDEAGWPFAE